MVIEDRVKNGINLHFCKNEKECKKITEEYNCLWLSGKIDSVINVYSEYLFEEDVGFINFIFSEGKTGIIIYDYLLKNKSKVIKAFDDNKIAYNLIK